jgi:hypothetical protein
MNLSSLNFSLLAIILLFVALMILGVLSSAPVVMYLAFGPALVWAIVLALRGRQIK